MKLEMLEQNKGNTNRDLRFRVTGNDHRIPQSTIILLLDKIVVIPDVVQQF